MGQSISSGVLAEAVHETTQVGVSARTIRLHIQKLGLTDIKKTLPQLVETLKKPRSRRFWCRVSRSAAKQRLGGDANELGSSQCNGLVGQLSLADQRHIDGSTVFGSDRASLGSTKPNDKRPSRFATLWAPRSLLG